MQSSIRRRTCWRTGWGWSWSRRRKAGACGQFADPEMRPALELAAKGARARGTPFISFFRPEEMLDLARACGFREVRHVSAEEITRLCFAGRSDGLRPPLNAEELLVAST